MRRQFNWLGRTGAVLLLAGGLVGTPASAQDVGTEGVMPAAGQPGQIETPDANDYLWIAGVSFKPRSTSTEYFDAGNGCLVSNTGGGAVNDSFTVPFRLPTNSVLRGVRFYYYDADAGSSSLSITSYDGVGGFIDHVFATSDGSSGYGSIYQALGTPFTVVASARAFVLNWYPSVAGSSMRLCGARVFYDVGSPAMVTPDHESAPVLPAAGANEDDANSVLASDYYFLAGSSFERVDSGILYRYGSSGCMYATTTYSALNIDLDVPDGSTLNGARFYFNDTSAASDVSVYLVDYTGLGGIRTLLQSSSSGSAGFSSVYAPINATYSPYVVDQFSYALTAVVTGANDVSRQICGVRVFYTLPAARPQKSAEPAVETFPAEPELTSPDLNSAGFTTNLQLPDNALVQGVRLFYFATDLPGGSATMWRFNGASASTLGHVQATTQTGYGSHYAALDVPYTVDYVAGTPGLVAKLVQSPQYHFCGARVFYNDGAVSRYRFIAGASFHPLDSTVAFNYQSPGCIELEYAGDDVLFQDGFD